MGENRAGRNKEIQKLKFLKPGERECDFSLISRAIRPSDSFRAQRKVVLRDEGNS